MIFHFMEDKNTPGIRGIKRKSGSSWGKSFCTLDIIGTSQLTLDVIDINGLNKNYSIFMESLFKRLEIMGVKTGTAYLDKEFFNKAVISKLDELKIDCNYSGFRSMAIDSEKSLILVNWQHLYICYRWFPAVDIATN